MKFLKWAACLALLALGGGAVFNQEVGKDKDKSEKLAKDKKDKKDANPAKEAKDGVEPPATHKVVKKPFKLEWTGGGILSSADSIEISYRPHPLLQPAEGQSTLVVKHVAAQGTSVKKGDVLIAFDTAKLQQVIANAEVEQAALEASIKLAAEELPLAEKSAPLELSSAEYAKKRADEELKYFLDIDKAQTEKNANNMVRFMKFYVDYAKEELNQLKKMYKSNDLTESTEKMILRRQENWLEQAQTYYQSAQIRRDYILKYSLPNLEKSLREEQARSTLNLEKAQKTLTPGLVQKQTALAKQRHDFAVSADRLAKLRKDLAAMTIAAPMDGIVYHGRFRDGTWSHSDSLDSRLMPGATAQPDRVLMTLVKPTVSEIQLSVEEKEVHLLKQGLKGSAKLPARPDRKLAVEVAKVSMAPVAPGKFAVTVRLTGDSGDLVPGLACNLKFTSYAKKDAIVVPNKCLHEEDGQDFVYALIKNDVYEKRIVTIGKTDGTDTEINAGLSENDKVLLESPLGKSNLKEKGAS